MAQAFEQRAVDVRGYEVPVQVGGSGPPLLLLHGAGGAGLVGPFEQGLAEEFQVYAPVHPGFAGTPLEDWVQGVDDVALHYVDVIGALGLARPTVLGISLGGWIATELAVFRLDLLARLVLVSAVGVAPTSPCRTCSSWSRRRRWSCCSRIRPLPRPFGRRDQNPTRT